VGICSTTYGDLVCRGCKRFAHEIVEWNGFADGQQQLVWKRLYRLREGAVLKHVKINDEGLLLDRGRAFRVPDLESLSVANVGYEVLRRSRNQTGFAALGMTPLQADATVQALFQQIELELYERSIAQYERDFHVPAR